MKKEPDVRYKKQLGYSRKTPNRVVEDMEFPGVPKKLHVEFLGVNQKQSGISKGDQGKIMWNFHGSLPLALEFLRDLTQICGISQGLSCSD